MKTMKKGLWLFFVFFAVVMVIGITVCAATADTTVYSGTWGDLAWTLNEDTGELVISGQGEMVDMPHEGDGFYSPVAWRNYSESIVSIIIEPGITTIGEGAFEGCTYLTGVTIPESVTSIGRRAFSDCYSLTSITIPDSVKSIGDYAFHSCTNFGAYGEIWGGLTSVIIGENSQLTSIGNWAFSSCAKLTDIRIPDSVTDIGDSAFSGCIDLKNVTIPNSVTRIGDWAFNGCDSLTNVTIPNSVTRIGQYVFAACSNLESLTLPFVGICEEIDDITYQYPFGCLFSMFSSSDSVATPQFRYGYSNYNDDLDKTQIVYYVPSSLKSITITGGNIPQEAFYNCSELTEIIILNETINIDRAAFYNCKGLTQIVIPNTVTSIGSYAFEGCTNLESVHITDIDSWCKIDFSTATSNPLYYAENLYLDGKLVTEVTIPEGTTRIKDYTFSMCRELKSVSIPDSVTSIGQRAFSNCTKLAEISIPNSVEKVGDGAFSGCDSLTYHEYDNAYYLGNDSNPYMILVQAKSKEIVSCNVHEDTKVIDSYAFSYCNCLEDVYIENIENWLKNSLAENSYIYEYGVIHLLDEQGNEITNLVIPDTIEHICRNAFRNCINLISVTIPENVTSIGDSAFEGCYKLVEVYDFAPAITVTRESDDNGSVGYYALDIYTSIYSNSKLWTDDDGFVFYENNETCYLISYVGNETVFTLPANCNEKDYAIYQYAFCDCKELKEIKIQFGVIEIGSNAFKRCDRLSKIKFTGCEELWKKITGSSSLEIKVEFDGHIHTGWHYVNQIQHQMTCPCGHTEKADHAWSLIETIESTHLEQGQENYICNGCFTTINSPLDKLPDHTWSDYVSIDNDRHQRTCECGEVLIESHTWDAGIITTEPTHAANGVKTYTCTACGVTKEETIEKTDAEHTYGNWSYHDLVRHKRECSCGETQFEDHTFVEFDFESAVANGYFSVEIPDDTNGELGIDIGEVIAGEHVAEAVPVGKNMEYFICTVCGSIKATMVEEEEPTSGLFGCSASSYSMASFAILIGIAGLMIRKKKRT